jgi:outer membrane receptor protein involved in Fe transport
VEALNRILAGSGLVATRDASGVVAVAPRPQSSAGEGPQTAAATPVEDIVVTGSRIRGGQTASPVIRVDAEQIREEGLADLGEVIRSLPQNFGGGQNPGVASGNLAGAGNANQNITGGSSLNLRGLGPDATLTLLNGRRMTYGGFVQAVDVSAIPVEAVDRIEIVADGASAIYGSDAVGGVANVILKRDYDGLSVAARYGGATDGGLQTQEYSATGGVAWPGGGMIATYRATSVDPIYARQRSYADHLVDPTTLYPGSDVKSGLVSLHHAFGEVVELQLDALRTERDQLHYYNLSGRTSRTTPSTVTSLIAPSVRVALPNDWSVSASGAWGEDDHDQYRIQTVVATGVSTVATDTCYCNESGSYEIGAEGPLFALSGGAARLAIGAGYRQVGFDQVNHATGAATIQGEENARSAYAELHLPLIGPDQNIKGVNRLTATAAVRGEDYSSFGDVTTPKLGLIYAPDTNVTLSASWGKSFKAPTLFERNYAATAYLYTPAVFGGTGYASGSTVLVLDGGNKDLKPERAETWSATVRYHPARLSGLTAGLTYFNIDYRDRVVQPIANATQALSNSIYAPFVAYSPSAETLTNLIASASGFYNYSGQTYDQSRVVAAIYTQYANVARQEVQGVDLSAEYRFDLGASGLTVRGAATWLDSRQTTLPGTQAFDLAGTLFRPAELNGRAGLVWSRGGLTSSAFVNYTSGVTDTVSGTEMGSFSTLDATVRYTFGAQHGVLSGVEFAISAQNLFDRAPPLYTPTRASEAAPYDSTNYSAIGRFLSVTISKRFGSEG